MIYPNRNLKPSNPYITAGTVRENCARLGLPVPSALWPCNTPIEVMSGARWGELPTGDGSGFVNDGCKQIFGGRAATLTLPASFDVGTGPFSVAVVDNTYTNDTTICVSLSNLPRAGYNTTYQWRLQPNNNGSASAANALCFFTYDNGSSTNAGASGMLDGRSHLFLGVRNGTNVRLYRDGSLAAENNGTARNVSGGVTGNIPSLGWKDSATAPGLRRFAAFWPSALSEGEALTLGSYWPALLAPPPSRFYFDVGIAGNSYLQGVAQGNILMSGSSLRDVASFRNRVIQGVSKGELQAKGLALQDAASFRTRVVQGISRGDIIVSGLYPRDLYVSANVNKYIQGITAGSLVITGLSPRDLKRASVPYYQGINPGTLQIVGLDIGNGYSGVAVGGKAAALKLGLFADADVWNVPLRQYTGKFKKIEDVRAKQEVLVDLTHETAQLELLRLQIQELEQTLGKLTKDNAILLMKKEAKEQERRVRILRHEYLLAEDEEIILILNM